MIKKLTAIFVCLAALCTACAVGCGDSSQYTPEDDESYFRIGDVYRVFTQSGERELIKDKPLESYVLPGVNTSEYAFDYSITYTIDSLYISNCIFVEGGDSGKVNSQCIEAIYDYLGIDSHIAVNETPNVCMVTGLVSYNEKVTMATTTITYNYSEHPDREVIGLVADVYKYTFSYEDRSVTDGGKVGEGSFTIYYNDHVPFMQTFNVKDI